MTFLTISVAFMTLCYPFRGMRHHQLQLVTGHVLLVLDLAILANCRCMHHVL